MNGQSGQPKLVIPGLGGLYASLHDLAYPLVRITAGLMLLPHGWPKMMKMGAGAVAANVLARRGIEPALPLAYLIIFLETVGGICIAIGFLTRPFALLLLLEFLVIIFKAHLPNGWSVGANGAEFVVMWGVLFLAILIRGGGPYSVDRAIGKEV
jgi:putative oxidoreductase